MHKDRGSDRPVRALSPWVPRVRGLERRLVLNATAELTAIGELLLTGDATDDFVQVSQPSTDRIQLLDGSARAIPIRVGLDAGGDPIFADSVATDAVTAGRLRIDLGAGDDLADVQRVDGLDIELVDSAGDDRVVLSNPLGASGHSDGLFVQSETIVLVGRSGDFDISNDTVELQGNVSVGLATGVTTIRLGGGSLNVVGSLTLSGDVIVDADDAAIDFAGATLSSSGTGHSLGVELGTDASLTLGDADVSAGFRVEQVTVDGGRQVQWLGTHFRIDGDLHVGDTVGEVTIESDVTAGSIDLQSNSLTLAGTEIHTTVGDVRIASPVTIDEAVSIGSAASLELGDSIVGTDTAGQLSLQARHDLRLGGAVTGPLDLDAVAGDALIVGQTIDLDGFVNLRGDRLSVTGDVTAEAVLLTGRSIVAPVQVHATAAGVTVDAMGGALDLTNSVLRSASPGRAIFIEDANAVVLGDLNAADGSVQLGTATVPVIGEIRQAAGTAIHADRVTLFGRGEIELTNSANRFNHVDEIDTFGDVALTTLDDLSVGVIRAAGSKIFLQAESINDADPDTRNDIRASDVVLRAASGIGNRQPLELDRVETLDASAFSGDVIINLSGDSHTTVENLFAGSGVSRVTQLGAQTLTIGQNFIAGGDLELISDQGGIVMQPGSVIRSDDGRVRIDALGDIELASVQSGSGETDAITIISRAGRIIDGDDTDVDLSAAGGGIVIDAEGGIGVGDALEVLAEGITSTVRRRGDVFLHALDSIEAVSLETFDGKIDVTTAGTLIASRVVSNNPLGIDDLAGVGEHRDIHLTTLAGGDLRIGQIHARNGADVHLVSADDITDTDVGDTKTVVADDLVLRAAGEVRDGDVAVRLTTQVNDLDARVTGFGDLIIVEQGNIELAASDGDDDAVVVSTFDGRIEISASRNISINDSDPTNDGARRRDDPEIIAGGGRGQIMMSAAGRWLVGDFVQLQASRSGPGAVTIMAEVVSIGEGFEINTGDGVGIAREFTPRPAADIASNLFGRPGEGVDDTDAFYDFESVRTNTLSQFAENDARGVFSVDIGTEGENGFSLFIDWGAPTNRFQRIDNLPGDMTTIDVPHVYTEVDIVNSTLNGRRSATDPLAVKFAVAHHESIVIQADQIFQVDRPSETIAGRLVTSTDNPLTSSPAGPIFENGTALFVIPRVDVPVAFFPVRDVIPEPPELPAPIRLTGTTFVIDAGFSSTDGPSSSTSIRQEFFQLRALSPDPGADDLVEPIRLPEDILSGEKLSRVFAGLPDGAYEIEYVIGDGDQRSILRVDLRDGKAVILDDDLDGGTLRLIPIDADEAGDDSAVEPSEDPTDEADTDAVPEGSVNRPLSRAGRFLRKVHLLQAVS